MRLPQGKLLALVAVFAALGVITATGAFTSVAAERTATVGVSGDQSALLGLAPYDGPNGHPANGDPGYATLASDTLEINLDGYSNAGDGLNLNAETDIENVFTVTNHGTQAVTVSIADTSADESTDRSTLVTFYNASADGTAIAPPSAASMDSDAPGSAVVLGPGENVVVGIYVDTRGSGLGDGDELIDGITITAEAVEE